jgi:hypothetical protein
MAILMALSSGHATGKSTGIYAKHSPEDWKVVIQTCREGKYDLAVHLLLDLRDLAARDQEDVKFKTALRQIQEIQQPSQVSSAGLAAAGL